jgi:hypothetical protein
MKRWLPLLVLLLCALLVLPASAQEGGEEEQLQLNFNRDFGYGGFGGEIQGRFSLKVAAPENLVQVEYFLDGERVFQGTEHPFRWQFNTANFPEGRHTFSAVGYRADGSQLTAPEFTRIFLSSDQAWSQTGDLLVPMLILFGVVALLGVLGPVLLGRRKKFTLGVYGMAGGAVCPRCTFPYARNMLSPNLLVGKLERCPHCGKWAIVPAASSIDLEVAEARYTNEDQGTLQPESQEDKLRQILEDSRYDD